MKIMFFTLTLRGGGAERVLTVLANEMSKESEVSILTIHNDDDYYEVNSKIHRLCIDNKKRDRNAIIANKMRKISPLRIKKLISIIRREKPDVVITFLPLPSLYITLAKTIDKYVKKVPVILSERGDPNKEYRNKLIALLAKKLYKEANGFVFQTKDAEDFFRKSISDNSIIIENPVNGDFLNHSVVEKRRDVIVSCGRLEKQKNFELLINAFSDIESKFPNYTLEIYGEGSKRDELLKYIRKINLDEKIILKGRVDNLADSIYDAKLFVLSSDYEGMPNALMEAMALGLPCISTDCPIGGPKALIKNGKNGILVEVNNKEQLSSSMSKVLSDPVLFLKLSENGMIKVKKYTAKNVAEKWKKFIKDIVGEYE